jgi:hypothetical protein
MVNWLNKILAYLKDHDEQMTQAMKDINIVLSSWNHSTWEEKKNCFSFIYYNLPLIHYDIQQFQETFFFLSLSLSCETQET